MQSEVNEKSEQRTKTSVTIPDVPITEVHEKIIEYRRQIMAKRNKDFTIMEAYREFLIEKCADQTAA